MVSMTTTAAALSHPISGVGRGGEKRLYQAVPLPILLEWTGCCSGKSVPRPPPWAPQWSWGDVLVAAQPESSVCGSALWDLEAHREWAQWCWGRTDDLSRDTA